MKSGIWKMGASILIAMAMTIISSAAARAHCDTMDGPLIMDAKMAFDKHDVIPTLKWVAAEKESEIQAEFGKAMEKIKAGENANEAKMGFYETLVRIHREGEGAEYSGVKPVGTPSEPGIMEADHSLMEGTEAEVTKMVAEMTAKAINIRFKKAVEAAKHKDDNVMAGREYVQAYIEYVHYIEALFAGAMPSAEGAHEKGQKEGHGEHNH